MEDSNTIVELNPNVLTEQENIIPTDIAIEESNDVVIPEEGEKESTLASASKKKKRLTSDVWAFYEVLPMSDDGKQRCKCKKCGVQYQCDSKYGTGNLRRHLLSCKKRDTRDIGQLILQTSTSSNLTVSDKKFDHSEFRDLLTACIIMHDLPFQCVEWVGFRALLLYLRPDLQLLSRTTARSDCKKLFMKEKCHIHSMFAKNTSRICFTSDLWTSINTDGFICLTAHFIDNNWCLRKKIINFSVLPPPHDGLTIFEKLQSFFVQWKIENKIFSITLDNASSNTVSIDYLRKHLNLKGALLCNGYFLHLRCCAHIVNLIVQEGLKVIDASIVKVRESIKYVKGSQARKQKFLECVSHSSLEYKKGLRQDVPTRWNSTYIMLDNAIYYRDAFTHLELVDNNFKISPTAEEWERIQRISSFLHPFYQITSVFSGTRYPTANLYFPCISTAYASLVEELDAPEDYIKRMTIGMLEKFEKYWSDFSPTLAVAVILDPRYKFQFIEWCYKALYEEDYEEEISKVREVLYSLFSNYSIQNLQSSGSQTKTVANPTEISKHKLSASTVIQSRFLKGFDSLGCEITMPKRSELESYLEEPRIDRQVELDILQYWKANQFRFPQVSAMARDVLCIPISTVASESAFSNSGRILDQYRSALKPDIVEALVCSKDWLYGEQVKHDVEQDAITENIINLTSESVEVQSSRAEI